MKITFHAREKTHQKEVAEALAESFSVFNENHDIEFVDDLSPRDTDLAVIWGVRKHKIINNQRARGKPYLVMERGYFLDRFVYTSLGFNGLNGRANFMNQGLLPFRWNEHFSHLMQPVRKNNSNTVVIIGQTPGDMSHAHVDIEPWYKKMELYLRRDNFNVEFRPHPNVEAPKETLDQMFKRVRGVVTFSSNTGVDAVLAGVPTIACDPTSMIFQLVGSSLDTIRNQVVPDRTQWANELAYTQWTLEEIASGQPWSNLRRYFL